MRVERWDGAIEEAGERLEIKVTDQGFSRDVASVVDETGNRLVDVKEEKGIITAVLEKGAGVCPVVKEGAGNNKTLIVFSDDLDKALASFVVPANGAASTGRRGDDVLHLLGVERDPERACRCSEESHDGQDVRNGRCLPEVVSCLCRR